MASALSESFGSLGVPSDSYVDLRGEPSPRHLRYMDLMAAGRRAGGVNAFELYPDAVIEAGGKPVVYVVSHAALGTSDHKRGLERLTRTLACRADARYLAVIKPGVATVYRIAFYRAGIAPTREATIEGPSELRALIAGMAEDRQRSADRLWLDTLLFDLLTAAATTLRDECRVSALSDSQLLSLIGRAVFTRFLVDRGIVGPGDIPLIAPGVDTAAALFATVEATARTFSWLDQTFNGDLLDLGTRDYVSLLQDAGTAGSASVCKVLSNVMACSIDGQMSLDWGGLQFRHIPVDVLSQVYEHFAHRYDPERAHATSIHFTPRAIAEILVDGAFNALPSSERASATVLDPAVGAGVFLVLAFRRIVAENWISTGKRPRRGQIRDVLRKQLCGLDINPQSIQVAALSLYLAALELDPDPQPLSELRFERVFDSTLICVDQESIGPHDDAVLGSLSNAFKDLGPFDIVLGNPPWTGLPVQLKRWMDELPCGLASRADGSLSPNQWPDIGFMWRSLNWCKPGGVIALLVHARLLLSRETFAVRRNWFKEVRLTGVLNGMALRKERRIWATNSQPFCALVAINRQPRLGDAFYFLTPRLETGLGARGEFRLDPRSACEVLIQDATERPSLFKTLSRGTLLDVELVDRLRSASSCSLDGVLERLGVEMRQGFIVGDQSRSAVHLRDYPVLEIHDKPKFAVVTSSLPKMRERDAQPAFQWPREEDIYKGPQLLFRQSPKSDPAFRGAILADGDVVFSRAFYGVRVASINPDYVDYLYVLSYSDVLVYWALMTSSQFGVERDTFNAEDFKTFPVPEPATLSQTLRAEFAQLRREIEWGLQPWEAVNAVCAKLFKLSAYDVAMIEDALKYELPYAESKARAAMLVGPQSAVVLNFGRELQHILRAAGLKDVAIRPWGPSNADPTWQFVQLSLGQLEVPDDQEVATLMQSISEPYMSSEIRVQLSGNGWLVGRLRQERYWSRTAARLLALELLNGELAPEVATA